MYSIVISTYNRDEILSESLFSYLPFLSLNFIFEILVIDNFGKSNTRALVEELKKTSSLPLVYIFEEKKGLSNARNSGIKNSKFDWIVFIDDDALVSHDYFIILNKILSHDNVKCLGGKYVPWYKYAKPKWYLDDWGSSYNKPSFFSKLNNGQFADGGNFVVNRQLFFTCGFFNENLGMRGSEIGYGEEVEFQHRLLNENIEVWYSPELLIYHLVPKYKMKVSWFLKSWYSHGKEYWKTYKVIPNDYGFGLGVLIRIVKLTIANFISGSKKFKTANYYIQNLIIDSLKVPAWELGKLTGAKKYKH